MFEKLLAEISASVLAWPAEHLDGAVRQALDRVRVFYGADRCGLLAVADGGARVFVDYASLGPGVGGPGDELNLAELFPWSARQLLNDHRAVCLPRVADLPPEADTDRASYRVLGTKSTFIVPIHVAGVACHLMVLGSVHAERDWSDVEESRLRLLGELFVAALERQRAFMALRDSEDMLQRAAAAARCGLWDIDAATGVIRLTSETRRIYGVEAHEPATVDTFLALVHDDDRRRVADAMQETLSTGREYRERYRIVRRDGAERWILATGRCEHDRLLGASVDITDTVRAEADAREQAARADAAVDIAQVGFYDWIVGSGSLFLDPRMARVFDVHTRDEEAALAIWYERMHPDDAARVREAVRQLVDGTADRVTETYRYKHPELGVIWLRHTARQLPTASGERRIIGALQDITESKRREEDLRRALDEVEQLRHRLEQENRYLRHEVRGRHDRELIVGRSTAIRRTLALADRVAATDSTVMLLGETGSGKERFATYIHEASRRRDRAMIRVNCSAIPIALIESELFGREKGAFTGALTRQAGRFEVANGSTIFLDEIGDLPTEVQVKLLRVLEDRTIERLGNPTPIPVDVRIIAATHRDLARAVKEGRFREDLYYRLNVFPVTVPPLRDRRDDIPLLAAAMVAELGVSIGKRFGSIDAESLEALKAHPWPGNVRELRNVIERSMILGEGPVLRVHVPSVVGEPEEVREKLVVVERDHVLQVLHACGWRIRGDAGAAARLGMKPTTLESRLKKLGITRPGQ